MQQMAPDIFVRILGGMRACRKKPAQPASGALSWMTPSETLLRLCLGGFGKIFAKQRLLLAFVRFHGPIFETEKPFENVCTTRGLPCSKRLFWQVPRSPKTILFLDRILVEGNHFLARFLEQDLEEMFQFSKNAAV